MKIHLTILLSVVLAGCATYHKTTTINLAPNGQTNSIVIEEHGRTDPLLTKTVEHEVNGSGVNLEFMGISGYAPFNLKFGNFDTTYRTLPTAVKTDGTVSTAPYNKTSHQNSSIIQHAGDQNLDSTGTLPDAAYHGPNIAVANPIVSSGVVPQVQQVTTNSPSPEQPASPGGIGGSPGSSLTVQPRVGLKPITPGR